jgi:CheY-like chemotaxis protein
VHEKFFELAGLHVVASFSDGRELLDFFSALGDASVKQKALSYNSIVMLDYRMVQEKSIREVVRRLRKINPKQKIILTTVGDPRYSDLSGFGNMFDAILRKPFTIKELIRIFDYLSSSRTSPPRENK